MDDRATFDKMFNEWYAQFVYLRHEVNNPEGFGVFVSTKLLQKREMRKDIVIELSYKGFSRASDYS